MKLDRVFLAFLKKDGEEHLLYKKNNYLYIDLNTKENFYAQDIDLRTLIYFKDSIDCYGDDYFKCYIKKMYNDDRKKLINIDNLFVVNIKKVSELKSSRVKDSNWTRYNWIPVYLYKNLLKKDYENYIDLRNGNKYVGCDPYDFENGTIYVDDGRNSEFISFKECYPSLKSVEKSKVLKLQYDVMNNDKIN